MSAESPPLTDLELEAHVARHEGEYVQQYVRALYEERAELTSQLGAVSRRGHSEDGRQAMQVVRRVLLVVAAIVALALAFVVGRLSG